ncbi:MAG: hypothetical protein AMXMBFR74_20130 [Parvibaculum sp.]
MWLRFCLWTLPFVAAPLMAAAGSALAQEPAPAGAHVEGVAAEAAAGADARRENVRGDETFQSSYTCVSPSGASDKAPIVCEGSISPVLPELYFSLSWHLDEFGDRAIETVHIRRKGEVEPFQTIGNVASLAASQIPNNDFELIDVNFDGYHDFRLIAAGTAGPNVLYRNWLWEPDEEAFVGNAALDELVSPEFDPETQEIVSRWRSSAEEGGVDIYIWEEGRTVLIHRETDRYAGPSACTRTFFDRIDGELRETGTGACG